jgi:hypothetical protein
MSQIILQTLDFASIGTPPVGEFYLGVDTDGIMKLKRNTDTLILSVTGSQFLQYTLVTYSDFLNLYNTSSLQPGGVYLINDFRTTHYVQFTDAVGDGSGLGESINYGSIEPIIVLATSTNSYDTNVKSLNYPDDEIKWLHEVTDREYDHFNNPSGTGRGHIIFRKSKSGNSRNYDFRNVIFYRWNDGSGNYTITRKIDAPNIFDYVSYKAFEEGFTDLRDNQIGSYLDSNSYYSLPYYLDNLVVSTSSSMIGNHILFGNEVTILASEFNSNYIFHLNNSVTFGTFSNNFFSEISYSTFSNFFTFNSGSKIINSDLSDKNFSKSNVLDSLTSSNNYVLITDSNSNNLFSIENDGQVKVYSNALDLMGNTISNSGLINGVDIELHSSRHLPNGLDPLTTGTPSTLGLTNSQGSSNAFSRQDHIHAHGNQSGGSLHSVVTASASGFMSSAMLSQQTNFKLILDSLITTTQSSILISATAVSINGILEDGTGYSGTSSQVLASTGTNVTWVNSIGSYLQRLPSDPSTTISTIGVMMGFGSTVSITPSKSGVLSVTVCGDTDNSDNGDGCRIQMIYGTATAPVNGAALTGTSSTSSIVMSESNSVNRYPFSLTSVIGGLSIGTQYWFDISLASLTGGTASVRNINFSIHEL